MRLILVLWLCLCACVHLPFLLRLHLMFFAIWRTHWMKPRWQRRQVASIPTWKSYGVSSDCGKSAWLLLWFVALRAPLDVWMMLEMRFGVVMRGVPFPFAFILEFERFELESAWTLPLVCQLLIAEFGNQSGDTYLILPLRRFAGSHDINWSLMGNWWKLLHPLSFSCDVHM